MNVLGIDCAPGKGSTVFDGNKVHPPEDVPAIAGRLDVGAPTLVCWDAPLTGPHTLDLSDLKSDYTQRCIESFFRREAGWKAPPGVSVQSYGSCSHWTVTRALVGLPQVGPYDCEPRYVLVTQDTPRPSSGRHIVEVHPGVALWLWTKGRRDDEVCWRYKGTAKCRDEKCPQGRPTPRAVREELVEALFDQVLGVLPQLHASAFKSEAKTDKLQEQLQEHDDKLDAFVAWLLGALWISPKNGAAGRRVALLGDGHCGSFLVPCVADEGRLQPDWEAFQGANCPARDQT